VGESGSEGRVERDPETAQDIWRQVLGARHRRRGGGDSIEVGVGRRGERLDEASGDCRVQAGRLGRLCKQQMTAWRQDGFEWRR